jgi:hypothetical protein
MQKPRLSNSFTGPEVRALLSALNLVHQDVSKHSTMLTQSHRSALRKLLAMRERFEKEGKYDPSTTSTENPHTYDQGAVLAHDAGAVR